MNALFFWLFSGGMILFALAVILNRNAVASALCFTFTIVFMSGLFVMLSAYFLAAVQILVTAGAVMVLFLFIIMLLDLTAMEHMPRQKIWMACSFLLAIGFIIIVAKTLHATPMGAKTLATVPNSIAAGVKADLDTGSSDMPVTHSRVVNLNKPAPVLSTSDADKNDDTHQIGRLLFSTSPRPGQDPGQFTSYVAPFEITSLLILVATIGVIVICKQDDKPRSRQRDAITCEAPPVETEPASRR